MARVRARCVCRHTMMLIVGLLLGAASIGSSSTPLPHPLTPSGRSDDAASATTTAAAGPKPLVKFTPLPFSRFSVLEYLPLPYANASGKTWMTTVSCCGYSVFTLEAVVNASNHYNILTPGFECDMRFWPGKKTAAVAEWGCTYSQAICHCL